MSGDRTLPAEMFRSIEGSMTSHDGQSFFLKVIAVDGTEMLIGFPHEHLSNIVENAAMQMAHGRDKAGNILTTAFNTTGFEVGCGPRDEVVLSFSVGPSAKISFLLSGEMREKLVEHFVKLMPLH